MGGMDGELEIAPEADADESAAIAKALGATPTPEREPSAWWREGQGEALRERPSR
jgi:hypothetical protein